MYDTLRAQNGPVRYQVLIIGQLSWTAGGQEELRTQVPVDGGGKSWNFSHEDLAYEKGVLGLSDLKIK